MIEIQVKEANVMSVGYEKRKYFLTYRLDNSPHYLPKKYLMQFYNKELDEIDRLVDRKLKLQKLLET